MPGFQAAAGRKRRRSRHARSAPHPARSKQCTGELPARAAGTARFAFNWALAEWRRQYDARKADSSLPKPNEGALRRQLNAIEREQFPWMLDVTKNAPQMAIRQPGRAFENFFARRAAYPTFRRKGRDDRFALSNDQFRIEDKRIRIPKLGWVRMREALRFAGRIVSAAISRVADRWYASITVDMPSLSLPPADNQGVVGIDLGTRQWTCPGCAASHDRDVNAAINLKNMAVSSIASACGGKGAGLARKCEAKPVPVNQESNGKVGYV